MGEEHALIQILSSLGWNDERWCFCVECMFFFPSSQTYVLQVHLQIQTVLKKNKFSEELWGMELRFLGFFNFEYSSGEPPSRPLQTSADPDSRM